MSKPFLQQQRQPSHLRDLIPLMTFLVLVCIACPIACVYNPQISVWLRNYEPSCSVGFNGTAATVTVQGWTSAGECQEIVSGQAQGVRIPYLQAHMASSVSGDVVCEYDLQGGLHLSVRNPGNDLGGGLICSDLDQSQ